MRQLAPSSVFFSLLTAILLAGGKGLKNVRLEVEPKIVEHGQATSMRCHYELEGVPLYSVKWYRGSQEFYRYSPKHRPPIKIFAEPWIKIDVNQSNESQVTIRNVNFFSVGKYSCEVTTDFPSFSTATSSQFLDVVVPPPMIVLGKRQYEPGDKLIANCSLWKSTPPASLSFSLNQLQITNGLMYDEGIGIDVNSNVQWNHQQWLMVQLDIESSHYSPKGELILRCTAIIPGIYEQSSEVQIGSVADRPVLDRVTTARSSNCHSPHRIGKSILILLLLYLLNHL